MCVELLARERAVRQLVCEFRLHCLLVSIDFTPKAPPEDTLLTESQTTCVALPAAEAAAAALADLRARCEHDCLHDLPALQPPNTPAASDSAAAAAPPPPAVSGRDTGWAPALAPAATAAATPSAAAAAAAAALHAPAQAGSSGGSGSQASPAVPEQLRDQATLAAYPPRSPLAARSGGLVSPPWRSRLSGGASHPARTSSQVSAGVTKHILPAVLSC